MATNEIYINTATPVSLTNLQDVDGVDVEGATSVEAGLFSSRVLDLQSFIYFTGGDTTEIAAGDWIMKNGDWNVFAEVTAVTLIDGTTWGTDAKGILWIKNASSGDFDDATPDQIDIFDSTAQVADVATASQVVAGWTANADIDGVEKVVEAVANNGKPLIPLLHHGLTTDDTIRIVGSESNDGEYDVLTVVDENHIEIDVTWAASKIEKIDDAKVYIGISTGNSMGDGTGGDYSGTIPATAGQLLNEEECHLFIFVDMSDTDKNMLLYKRCRAAYYEGE